MRIRIELSKNEKKALKGLINKTALICEAEEIIEDSQTTLEEIDEKLERSLIKEFHPDFAYSIDTRFSGIDVEARVADKYVVDFLNACKKLVRPVVAMYKWTEKLIKKEIPAFMEEFEKVETPFLSFGRNSKDMNAMYIGIGLDADMVRFIDEDVVTDIYLDDESKYDKEAIERLKQTGATLNFGFANSEEAWNAHFDCSVTE